MARIPLGDFGGVVARPVERPSGDPSAYGAGVGQALQTAGSIGMRGAQQEMDQAASEADRAKRQAEADAKQAARERAAEAKAVERQLSAAKAATVQYTAINDLHDLQREVAAGIDDGTVERGKAVEHFNARAQKLVSARLEGLDPVEKELAGANLIDNVGASRRTVADLVAQRGKQELIATKDTFFEQMQRYAAAGPKEADDAIAKARAYPMAGEDPKAASLRVQAFAERVRFTQASSLVNTDPGAALKALKDPKYLPELDPGARTNLIQTADVRVTQAANRAEVAAQASARRLNQEWGAVQSVYEAGKALSPEYLEQKRKQFQGTPFAAALEQMASASPMLTAFASQPLPAQEASLMALQQRMNSGGATPAQIEEYQRREKAFKANAAAANADPYMAYAEVGGIGANDLAPLQLDMQTIGAQLERRREVASRVSQWAGREVSLFRPAEAEKLSNVLAAMPPKDRAGALEGLAKVMTPSQRMTVAAQIEPKDKAIGLAMQYAGKSSQVTTTFMGMTVGQPSAGYNVPELILSGQQARQEGTSTKGDKAAAVTADRWRAHAATELADLLPNQIVANQMRDSAELMMHGIAAKKGGGLTKEDMDLAVRLAVGGSIVEHNGKRIPLPAGLDEDALSKRLQSVTEKDIGASEVIAGGIKIPAADFIRTLPGQQLSPHRSGQYAVIVGNRLVRNAATGAPIVIGVR